MQWLNAVVDVLQAAFVIAVCVGAFYLLLKSSWLHRQVHDLLDGSDELSAHLVSIEKRLAAVAKHVGAALAPGTAVTPIAARVDHIESSHAELTAVQADAIKLSTDQFTAVRAACDGIVKSLEDYAIAAKDTAERLLRIESQPLPLVKDWTEDIAALNKRVDLIGSSLERLTRFVHLMASTQAKPAETKE